MRISARAHTKPPLIGNVCIAAHSLQHILLVDILYYIACTYLNVGIRAGVCSAAQRVVRIHIGPRAVRFIAVPRVIGKRRLCVRHDPTRAPCDRRRSITAVQSISLHTAYVRSTRICVHLLFVEQDRWRAERAASACREGCDNLWQLISCR